jgi:Anthrone oxygenase
MNPDIIHALETVAIVVAGTLTGSELAVAVFFHPRISRLDDAVHIRTAQTLAKVLGMVMPFWYALTFLLALALTFVAHPARSMQWWLALAATVLYALISVYSVLLPVPINNQVARWQPDSVPANWRDMRRRWDLLHALRVVFLVITLILLVASCVY